MMPAFQRKHIKASDLERIEHATYEEILVGDFVRLASGGPLGLVAGIAGETATGTWLMDDFPRFSMPWICLRQARVEN